MYWNRDSLLLYAVTDRAWTGDRQLKDQVEDALKGGVTCVQLREKDLNYDDFLNEASEIKALCHSYKTPLIVNDNVEVAVLSGADGIHVGQQDTPAHIIKDTVGAGLVVGVSVFTLEQALKAQADGADYLGIGAVFPTLTKEGVAVTPLETVRAICGLVSIPVVAIGGINLDNLYRLVGTGITGVALVSAIFASKSIENTCRSFKSLVSDLFVPSRQDRHSDVTGIHHEHGCLTEASDQALCAGSAPCSDADAGLHIAGNPEQKAADIPRSGANTGLNAAGDQEQEAVDIPRSGANTGLNAAGDQRPDISKKTVLIHKKTAKKIPVRKIIFDMDGTLLDSMKAYENLPERYLLKQNIQPREDLSERFRTLTFSEATRIYQNEYGIVATEKEILQSFSEMLAHFYTYEVRPKAGAPEFLHKLASNDIEMCVATATDRLLADIALKCSGLRKYFSFIISGSDVGAGKEAPCIFEEAQRRLDGDKSNTLVFEDAAYAVKTAVGAGFPVIGVYDDAFGDFAGEIKELSHMYIESFEDIDVILDNEYY